MKIYFVRHGESQANLDNHQGKTYYCGQLDVDLTQTGRNSAQALESYFNTKDIQHAYVSDLKRTVQTYSCIFPYDIPTTLTPLLRERSLGVFEGKNQQELEQISEYKKYFTQSSYMNFRNSYTQRVPQGENYQDVIDRFEAFFNHTVNSTYDTIVVVAHQILIRCALVYLGVLKREDAKQIHIENCKPIVVEI